MARMRRLNPVDIPQHGIQRGNNCQACFTWSQVKYRNAACGVYGVGWGD